MAIYDWNKNGKNDMVDNYIEYKVFMDFVERKGAPPYMPGNRLSILEVTVIVVLLLFLYLLIRAATEIEAASVPAVIVLILLVVISVIVVVRCNSIEL